MVLSHCENAKKYEFVVALLISYATGKANRGNSCTLGTRGGAAIALAASGQAVRGRESHNKLDFSAFERFVRFDGHLRLESAADASGRALASRDAPPHFVMTPYRMDSLKLTLD